MGQCFGKTEKNKFDFFQLQLPKTEYGDCSNVPVEKIRLNKNGFNSRFEQALKEGEDNDFKLVDKCRTIQKPKIFVCKQENSLYSKQKVLIELLNFRSKHLQDKLGKKNRAKNKYHLLDRKIAEIDSKKFAQKVFFKFRHMINLRKYNRVVVGRSYFEKRTRIKINNGREKRAEIVD